MISEIDDALRSLIRTDALGGATDVEVVLDAPTKDWAARRNAPTVNLYLYDIREDLRRREAGHLERVANGSVVSRRPVQRFFKLSYLVTAWTQRPEDEHRLLASLMRCFLKYNEVPATLVPTAADDRVGVPITVGLPPPEDRAFADVWTALGGELKPSLDVVVIAPMDFGFEQDAGAPVSDGAYINMSDTVHGGDDAAVHQHTAPPPSPAAIARLGIASDEPEASEATSASGADPKRGADLQLGRGRKPRNQKRDAKP